MDVDTNPTVEDRKMIKTTKQWIAIAIVALGVCVVSMSEAQTPKMDDFVFAPPVGALVSIGPGWCNPSEGAEDYYKKKHGEDLVWESNASDDTMYLRLYVSPPPKCSFTWVFSPPSVGFECAYAYSTDYSFSLVARRWSVRVRLPFLASRMISASAGRWMKVW